MNSDKHSRIKKLIYRSCHRGCKETDYIFCDFATANLSKMSEDELSMYEDILAVDDATIYNWFNGAEPIEPKYNNAIFQAIKQFNDSRF